ncbi:MAG TPA: class I SAM-dependent methyltransferase [Thermoleophilaceae bacterium]|nr:class I SAM-dependent methyltransferase [Thermoleophilaceae bacterium]
MISANDEAIEAWDGVLFDRFAQFRHVILPGFGIHSDRALLRHPPFDGERVLDIGCGFGDTTRQLADLVGPGGTALGVDAAPRFVEAARAESEQAGAENVRFEVADVQATPFDEQFDYAFSRFGTMFFANPVAALRNVREALAPGGRLCMVVWRRKLDNPWLQRSEEAVERYVTEDEDSDEPTCGPGPFSMANADTTSDIVLHAGFEDVTLDRSDAPMRLGADLDEATAYVMALGPAAEVIRLAGDDAERLRPEITAAVRDVLAEYDTADGVFAPMSTWIVSARAPG